MRKINTIVLYPEYYLLPLLLPYQVWPLAIALFLLRPKAKTILLLEKLYYVSTDGELIPLGKIQKKFTHNYFTLYTCGFGKSLLLMEFIKPSNRGSRGGRS